MSDPPGAGITDGCDLSEVGAGNGAQATVESISYSP